MLSGKLDNKIISIRRGYELQKYMCHVSHNESQTFKTYGLNAHKNFLLSTTITATDTGNDETYNELNETIVDILLSLFEECPIECAAIFVVKQDGRKIIYQIDRDYYFNGEEFEESEPSIKVSRITHDDSDVAFEVFDAEYNYEAYGLIVEINKGEWMSIVE